MFSNLSKLYSNTGLHETYSQHRLVDASTVVSLRAELLEKLKNKTFTRDMNKCLSDLDTVAKPMKPQQKVEAVVGLLLNAS